MIVADKPWKQHERKGARIFGVLRKPGSGSQGRADETRSDSKHERLFLECRTRKKSVVRTWLMEARRLARKENKTALLAIREAGKPGAILCVHQDDLDAVVVDYVATHYARLHGQITALVRSNYAVKEPPHAD